MKPNNTKFSFTPHGGGIRGADSPRSSSTFEGRFGRIFRELPAAKHSKDDLLKLALLMTAPPEMDDKGKPAAALETADHIQDDEENAGIPAGYTYFGQFIDHDITFDPMSSLMQQNDPEGLVDFRTPRLDLDNMYGRGPADQPYMYIDNKFRLGKALFANSKPTPSRDLPRYRDPENTGTSARALIGDKRNDENVIVSQLHSAFLQLHNRLVDEDAFKDATFEEIQRQVRWHYQYVVLNDFLPHICGKELIDEIMPFRLKHGSAADKKPKLQFFHYRNDPYIPLEFSVAAYRFGHSMVRPIYRLNTELKGGDNPDEATTEEKARGLEGRFFIFAGVNKRALNGFGEFPDQWAIDWSLFFDINGSGKKGGKERAQPAYKIDTSLVNPLGFLPEFSVVKDLVPPLTVAQMQPAPVNAMADPANLAARNLLRGLSMGMPSGQDIARAMGLSVIPDNELRVGKAIVDELEKAPTLVSISPAFADNAPLWYYVLAEAQHSWLKKAKHGGKGDEEPLALGPMGGRIVAETLIGLIAGDPQSFLHQDPNWLPFVGGRDSTVGKLVNYALTGQK
ncbi:peroxidase family protein [Undibacterium terreum]|uniref:Heme peroxidase n=1 Tax=Undibacterium terreum TaxID=1224302 RepID=A0A916XDA1_9BURK|nr:heme peroxidase family protein [Undibacterium terreum]GGC65461.1 heme peroxidase [Undibacterium terreum]